MVPDNIHEYLLCDGIKKNYTTWIWHDELTDLQRESQSELVDVQMGDHLEEMIRDLGQEFFQQAHAPIYDALQSDLKEAFVSGVQDVYNVVVSSVKSG